VRIESRWLRWLVPDLAALLGGGTFLACLILLGRAPATLPYAIAIAACSWLWVRLSWAVGGGFLMTALLAAPMLCTVSGHWRAQPHVFGWLFLLAAVLYLELAGERFRARDAIVVGLGAALWTNLHPSFLFAPLVALLYAAAHLARPFLWNLERATEWSRVRWYVYAAVFAVLGTFLNPSGYALHARVERHLIDSFQPASAAGSWLILLLAAAAAVLAWQQKKLAHALLLTALFIAGLRWSQGLPLAALVALPLASGALTEALRKSEDLEPRLQRLLRTLLAASQRLRMLDARLSGLALLFLMLALACV
jgi:hypothetical protein